MQWFNRVTWKVGIVIAGILLLLLLTVWIPLSARAYGMAQPGLFAVTGTVTVQATPTVDATVTVLNKEKLQNENDWWWNYGAAILTSVISTLTLAAAGLFTVVRYFNDRRDTREKQETEAKRSVEERKAERERRDEEQQRWLKDREAEREKRAEERFQVAAEGLSSEREEAKVGAAILLRTFLHQGYEQFYLQTFDLAVANLRLPRVSQLPEDPNTPLPLTTFSQALIVVFKEAFPLVRDLEKRDPRFLDATGVQLDYAYLWRVDLRQAWMRRASLREANLFGGDFSHANFSGGSFSGANLQMANFSNAYLRDVNFSRANLREADFSKTSSRGINVPGFNGGNFSEAYLKGANFSEAYLKGANFSGAYLTEANIEDALSLKGVDLRKATGLTKEQLATCQAKGAIIDEETATDSSQITVSTLPPSQINGIQAPLVPSAQGSISPPDPDRSNTDSTQQEPAS